VARAAHLHDVMASRLQNVDKSIERWSANMSLQQRTEMLLLIAELAQVSGDEPMRQKFLRLYLTGLNGADARALEAAKPYVEVVLKHVVSNYELSEGDRLLSLDAVQQLGKTKNSDDAKLLRLLEIAIKESISEYLQVSQQQMT